jgi:hypothetical protein
VAQVKEKNVLVLQGGGAFPPAWKNRTPPKEGVAVLDLTRDLMPGYAGASS